MLYLQLGLKQVPKTKGGNSMKRSFVLVLALVCLFAIPAYAGSLNENANSSDYVVKAPAMIVRGASNIGLGALEVPVHTYKGTVEGKPIVGTLGGIGTGVMYALDVAGRGVWDVLTAFAPKYNGAPSEHKLEPEVFKEEPGPIF